MASYIFVILLYSFGTVSSVLWNPRPSTGIVNISTIGFATKSTETKIVGEYFYKIDNWSRHKSVLRLKDTEITLDPFQGVSILIDLNLQVRIFWAVNQLGVNAITSQIKNDRLFSCMQSFETDSRSYDATSFFFASQYRNVPSSNDKGTSTFQSMAIGVPANFYIYYEYEKIASDIEFPTALYIALIKNEIFNYTFPLSGRKRFPEIVNQTNCGSPGRYVFHVKTSKISTSAAPATTLTGAATTTTTTTEAVTTPNKTITTTPLTTTATVTNPIIATTTTTTGPTATLTVTMPNVTTTTAASTTTATVTNPNVATTKTTEPTNTSTVTTPNVIITTTTSTITANVTNPNITTTIGATTTATLRPLNKTTTGTTATTPNKTTTISTTTTTTTTTTRTTTPAPVIINGGWSEWIVTAECVKRNNTFVRPSRRECNNPTPVNGKHCQGENRRFTACTPEQNPPVTQSTEAKLQGRLTIKNLTINGKTTTNQELQQIIEQKGETYKKLKNESEAALLVIFRKTNPNVVRVIVQELKVGSLIVDYVVVFDVKKKNITIENPIKNTTNIFSSSSVFEGETSPKLSEIADYNECDDRGSCDTNAHCLKFKGVYSYSCQCKAGFTGTGFSCQAVKSKKKSSKSFLILIVLVVVSILLVALVAICCYIRLHQKKKPKRKNAFKKNFNNTMRFEAMRREIDQRTNNDLINLEARKI
ncbi:uncharacterized protein DDB_G0280205-like isoform X2 [Hydractinia symbiolongicarpus]|uniref:uncharacterized protein DDB_G0280205-like isoform X2 n=1 Tax=Hydractinia symbiolongicarpus TaxID=13093 RepID=UPI002551462F|nr:uncharacterized protein DDB_G0280205-like isoform X2 [Hydractinia symbiolongicarpus]